MRDTAGSAAAPAARCRNCLRGSFIESSLHSGDDPCPASLRLDVRGPDHLAPLLGLFGDELAEVGRRACKRPASQIGKSRLDLGIGETRVDLYVQPFYDLDGSVFGRAHAEPAE